MSLPVVSFHPVRLGAYDRSEGERKKKFDCSVACTRERRRPQIKNFPNKQQRKTKELLDIIALDYIHKRTGIMFNVMFFFSFFLIVSKFRICRWIYTFKWRPSVIHHTLSTGRWMFVSVSLNLFVWMAQCIYLKYKFKCIAVYFVFIFSKNAWNSISATLSGVGQWIR